MNKDIKIRLIKIDLLNSDKINLWLVYKGLKRAAVLDTRQIEKREKQNLIKLLNLTGIKYKILDDGERYLYCISRNLEDAVRLSELLQNFDLSNKENHLESGELFSFPKKCVVAYTENITGFISDENNVLVGPREFYEKYKILYWTPYVSYLVRRGYEKEDSLQGKTWADEIRKELPEIAERFEKEIENPNFR